MTLVLTLSAIGNAMTNMATASRQLWAFARDKGVPFHGWFATVNKRLEIPLNGTCSTYPIEHHCPTSLQCIPPEWALMTDMSTYSRPLHSNIHRPHLPHQHRLSSSLQPDQLSRCWRASLIVPPLHNLRDPPSRPKHCFARLVIHARSLQRSSDQRVICGVPQSGICDEFFSAWCGSECSGDELGEFGIYECGALGGWVLCGEGTV